MPKYDKLREWLLRPKLTLTFSEIESIIQPAALPAAARTYRPWWANEKDAASRQCRAWLDAGWEVDAVDLKGHTVTFRRSSKPRTQI
jgi:hypothetical protein